MLNAYLIRFNSCISQSLLQSLSNTLYMHQIRNVFVRITQIVECSALCELSYGLKFQSYFTCIYLQNYLIKISLFGGMKKCVYQILLQINAVKLTSNFSYRSKLQFEKQIYTYVL